MSRPPTFASTSTTSVLSGWLMAMALEMTSFFFWKASSVMPPPRPVTCSTGASSSTDSTAAEVVVLPMPISPTPRALASVRMASPMPVRMARVACSRVMAGSFAMLRVP